MHDKLISSIKKNSYAISGWFEKHHKRVSVPLITALTIKDSGFKVSVSHINSFPMGLNYLSSSDLRNTKSLIKKYFKKHHSDIPKLKKILILTTIEHQNPFYYDHIFTLVKLLKQSSFKVELATVEKIEMPVTIKTPSKKTLKIFPALLDKNRLKTELFNPDFILLTDAFKGDLSLKLGNLEQPMSPPSKVTRHYSKKSNTLNILNNLMKDFSVVAEVDPWLITSQYHIEHHVNFEEKSGIEKVAHSAQQILAQLEQKYKEYNVAAIPSIQITNNSGAFGMGMISIKSIQELSDLYYKKKAKKVQAKSQAIINDVLIEETVPVRPLLKKFIGEAVIYLIGNEVAGGYVKVYTDRTTPNIVSSRNELFQPLKIKQSDKSLGLLYHNLSRLGGLAIGYEIDKIPS